MTEMTRRASSRVADAAVKRPPRDSAVMGAMRFVLPRLLRALLVFMVSTFIVFNFTALIPGDPAVTMAGENADQATIDALREQLGLDRPWYEQYFGWLLGVAKGDFGTSLFYHVPVGELMADRFPATASIALSAILIAAIGGVLAGVLAAARRGRPVDKAITVVSTLGIVTPNFWVGMILVLVFSFAIPILPAVGYTPFAEDPLQWFLHLILPAIALALSVGAELQRQTRSSISDVLSQDYIRTARAQGLSRGVVLWGRALKNGAVPVATVIGYQTAALLGGSVVVEKVFNISGLGTLAINSVVYKDLPVLQGVILINVVIVIIVNLLTDIAYTVLNPKVRVS